MRRFEGPEGGPHHEVAELPDQVVADVLPDHVPDGLGDGLGQLEHHVADNPSQTTTSTLPLITSRPSTFR